MTRAAWRDRLGAQLQHGCAGGPAARQRQCGASLREGDSGAGEWGVQGWEYCNLWRRQWKSECGYLTDYWTEVATDDEGRPYVGYG